MSPAADLTWRRRPDPTILPRRPRAHQQVAWCSQVAWRCVPGPAGRRPRSRAVFRSSLLTITGLLSPLSGRRGVAAARYGVTPRERRSRGGATRARIRPAASVTSHGTAIRACGDQLSEVGRSVVRRGRAARGGLGRGGRTRLADSESSALRLGLLAVDGGADQQPQRGSGEAVRSAAQCGPGRPASCLARRAVPDGAPVTPARFVTSRYQRSQQSL